MAVSVESSTLGASSRFTDSPLPNEGAITMPVIIFCLIKDWQVVVVVHLGLSFFLLWEI